MTREEVLEEIKNYENYPNGLSKECRDYIVKALEQEPTTKNDLGVECIDRAELLKAMDTWDKFGYTETGAFVAMRGHYGDYLYTPYVHYDDIVKCVKDMPSVTPIRPKGHWIEVTNGRGGHECDVCHDYAPSFQNGSEYLSAFCPNCGAKMEVEQ